jgi:hypothetical protein
MLVINIFRAREACTSLLRNGFDDLSSRLCSEGLREANEILWNYLNEAMTRTLDVSYQKERDRYGQGHDNKCDRASPMRGIADQQSAENGNNAHKAPSRSRQAVPPSGLRISL